VDKLVRSCADTRFGYIQAAAVIQRSRRRLKHACKQTSSTRLVPFSVRVSGALANQREGKRLDDPTKFTRLKTDRFLRPTNYW